MFTIKWIAGNGYEHIYQGREVRYVPASSKAEGSAFPNETTVEFDITGQSSNVEGDSSCILDSGRVYVMNEAGKTVADYVLSSNEFPHGINPRQAA
jgi:hypothetical protein